jgi:hypothetical protein
MAYGGAVVDEFSLCCSWRWLLILCMKVVLPDPAIPTHTTTTGAGAASVEAMVGVKTMMASAMRWVLVNVGLRLRQTTVQLLSMWQSLMVLSDAVEVALVRKADVDVQGWTLN